jgi:hypothetical protein
MHILSFYIYLFHILYEKDIFYLHREMENSCVMFNATHISSLEMFEANDLIVDDVSEVKNMCALTNVNTLSRQMTCFCPCLASFCLVSRELARKVLVT